MTKDEYKNRLRKHGYTFKGDIAILKTPYGVWEQKIEQDSRGNFGLTSINHLKPEETKNSLIFS